jgi:methionyl aminopeptidase
VTRATIKKGRDIELMRKACQITAQILDEVESIVTPGRTTEEINLFVHDRTMALGATPAPLHYKGFPKSVCTSVNEVICHGIPSPYVGLKEGDIINIDVTSIYEGFYGDSSRMYLVGGAGACSPEAIELVEHTRQALAVAIKEVKPKAKVGDLGAAISEYIDSTGKNYGIVREYTGHGIGRSFHEPPQIVHIGRRGYGDVLKEGMTFTIEPMINLGTHKTILSSHDGWTVRTADGLLSAQWEHTVLVTEESYEILTVSPKYGWSV